MLRRNLSLPSLVLLLPLASTVGCGNAAIEQAAIQKIRAVEGKVEFRGQGIGTALLLTAPAVVAAAVAESIRSRINDNIRVGIVAAVAIVLLHNFRSV